MEKSDRAMMGRACQCYQFNFLLMLAAGRVLQPLSWLGISRAFLISITSLNAICFFRMDVKTHGGICLVQKCLQMLLDLRIRGTPAPGSGILQGMEKSRI